VNISEGNDLNVLLRYVLNVNDGHTDVPTVDKAREAAERLADRANKVLGAGLTSDRIAAMWPDLLLDNGVTIAHNGSWLDAEDYGNDADRNGWSPSS
jgi:hypothetical protein